MRGNLPAYWADTPSDIIASLESSASGLSQRDAEQRLKRYGENRIAETRGVGKADQRAKDGSMSLPQGNIV